MPYNHSDRTERNEKHFPLHLGKFSRTCTPSVRAHNTSRGQEREAVEEGSRWEENVFHPGVSQRNGEQEGKKTLKRSLLFTEQKESKKL